MKKYLYKFGAFTLKPAAYELMFDGADIPIQPNPFNCLVYLIENRDRVVGRDELISAVWGKLDVSDSVVTQTLRRARQAINDSASQQNCIRTVSGVGYQWVAPVEEVLQKDGSDTGKATDDSTLPFNLPHVDKWLFAILLLSLVVVAIWWLSGETPETDDDNLVVVLPATITPDNEANAWLRLGAMNYIAGRLRTYGQWAVMPTDQTLRLESDHLNYQDTFEFASHIKKLTGAQRVLVPSVTQQEEGWHVQVTVFDGKNNFEVEAHSELPLKAANTISNQLLRRFGNEHSTIPPLTALTERLEHIDAEILVGRLNNARMLIQEAPVSEQKDAQLRIRQAQLEFRAGQLDSANTSFSALLAESNQLPADVRVKALIGMGAVELRNRRFEIAEQYYQKALDELALTHNASIDMSLKANAYNGLGVAEVELGRLDTGIASFSKARIAMQRAGNQIDAAAVASNIGILETRRGNFTRALDEFEQAISVFERYDVNDNLAATLLAKANTEMRLVLPDEAETDILQAVDIAPSLENPKLVHGIATSLIDILISKGQLQEAEQRVENSPEEMPERQLRLYLEQGNFEQAHVLANTLEIPSSGSDGELALLVIQSAIANDDPVLAAEWTNALPVDQSDSTTATMAALAKALAAQAFSDEFHQVSEMQAASDPQTYFRSALNSATQQHSPINELRVGSALVMYLVKAGQADLAVEWMGRLTPYANRSYHVARAALALYQALGDNELVNQAQANVESLAGQRDTRLPVVF